jgi:hypothetical protein
MAGRRRPLDTFLDRLAMVKHTRCLLYLCNQRPINGGCIHCSQRNGKGNGRRMECDSHFTHSLSRCWHHSFAQK